MNTKTRYWPGMLAAAAICLIAATPAPADWFEGELAKWVQLPDFDPATSLDVRMGRAEDDQTKTLADDFLCRETGPITSVHIWTSWKNDFLPFGEDPNAVDFRLSIHKDIPATAESYSRPEDPPIWEGFFGPGSFQARFVEDTPQGWYDPNTNEYEPQNHFGMWQYNFDLTDSAGVVPPWQEGTPDRPVVYWLDVSAIPHDPLATIGWKTSRDHWNDDAVWRDENAAAGWSELRYPIGHPLEFESIDLAFVVVPEPTSLVLLTLGALLMALPRRRR